MANNNRVDHWEVLVRNTMGAEQVERAESIQSLWSGYGEIFRARLSGAAVDTVVLKHVSPPAQQSGQHPKGWHSDFATRRKLRSYEVESNWYKHWSYHCNEHCRVPQCYGTDQQGTQRWILLEDLDAAGYPVRHSSLSDRQALSCIDWLAHFHATYLNKEADNLWDNGSYWHLATRPDELRAMAAGPLRDHAALIDSMLSNCRYKTLVHGDAKVANFCFGTGTAVAAVDFQYIGAACGMKDIAYFIGSCLDEEDCEKYAPKLLDRYFTTLKMALSNSDNEKATAGENIDFNELESEWRALYSVAWTDFHRFLLGWMPTHHKIHRYTEKLTADTLTKIKSLGQESS